MLHNIWIMCSIFLILLIISSDPKSPAVESRSRDFRSLNRTENTRNNLIWFLIFLLILLTSINFKTTSF